MIESYQRIQEILEQFKEYLETEEAKKHLKTMEGEKSEVKEIMQKLSPMDKKSLEFTDLVLYGLLPYSKTSVAKRVSLFPAFMNIRVFFQDLNYSEEEWNLIANKTFILCDSFIKNPEKVAQLIKEFAKDKYSRRLQCGSITPILFCLSDSYPIVNNRTIRAFRSISLILGENRKLSQKLVDYTKNIKDIEDLVKSLKEDLLKNYNFQDLFFYWYDSEILSEERRTKKDDSEGEENIVETEEEVKKEEINFDQFLENINLEKGFDFIPHSLGDPQRVKINQIIQKVLGTRWVLPRFQRYFD